MEAITGSLIQLPSGWLGYAIVGLIVIVAITLLLVFTDNGPKKFLSILSVIGNVGLSSVFTRSRHKWSKEKLGQRNTDLESLLATLKGGRSLSPEAREKMLLDLADTVSRAEGDLPDIESILGNVNREPNWIKELNEELGRVSIGQIVFNPCRQMKQGVSERVTVRISKDITSDLVTSLKGRGVTVNELIDVYEVMVVNLTGDDFTITELSESEQLVAGKGFTEWAWNITSTKSGTKTLHLHVTLRINLANSVKNKDHPVIDRDISVEVNPLYSVKLFLENNWQWVIASLLIPIIAVYVQA